MPESGAELLPLPPERYQVAQEDQDSGHQERQDQQDAVGGQEGGGGLGVVVLGADAEDAVVAGHRGGLLRGNGRDHVLRLGGVRGLLGGLLQGGLNRPGRRTGGNRLGRTDVGSETVGSPAARSRRPVCSHRLR